MGASVSSSEIAHEILDVVQGPVTVAIRGEPIPAFGWEPFLHPKIEVRKGISKLDPTTGDVHFTDGSTLSKVDHVIFGTGYTFSVPFLPEVQKRVLKAYRRLPGVYQHTWNIEDPSLTFVGMVCTFIVVVRELSRLTVQSFSLAGALRSGHTSGKPWP